MLRFSNDHERIRRVVTDRGSFATTLYSVALRLFGTEIHGWEPEMFDLEFRDELNVDVPPINQDKLLGLLSAIKSDAYYTDFVPFTAISELMNGNEADFETITPDLTPAEMAWAVTEVQLADDDEPNFSPDVASYVGVILHENGFLSPPPQLSFATMPEVYLGSTFGEDVDQIKSMNQWHFRTIDTYIKDQSTKLFEQLSGLPWVTEETLEELSNEIRRMSFRTRVIPVPAIA